MYLGGMEAEQVFIQEPWKIPGIKVLKYPKQLKIKEGNVKTCRIKKNNRRIFGIKKGNKGKKKNYKSQIIFR